MAIRVREERGVPEWLVRAYLKELGGVDRDDGWLVGDGWAAIATQIDDHQIGSIVVGQVRIELEGDDETLTRLEVALDRKLMRGGG